MSAPERASRQNLVIPPRHGNTSVVLGAAVCGCIGFAMVWAFGVGRHSHSDHLVPSTSASADESEAAMENRWRPRTPVDLEHPAGPPVEAAIPSRQTIADPAVAPASLATPASATLSAGRSLSRFSVSPEQLADPAAESDTAPPGRLALPPEDELGPALESPPPESDITMVEPPLGDPEPLEPHAVTNDVSTEDVAATATTSHETEEPADPSPPEAAHPFMDEAPATPPPPLMPFQPMATDAPPVPPPAARDFASPPVQPPHPATVPFASAPAIVPSPPADRTGPATPPVREMAGQGRPGPIQLEGVQTPQLTVEKRGPREVQVGKPARYEILVRNVGGAVARDVTLRDAVPYGTTLVTTTPPAAPGRAGSGASSDELIWDLGELAPGGQARVVVELVPHAEGEVGSVASVTFRADASVRSRATKPALAIQCTDPKPVLIGRDAGLTITITNPGSGVATGVVLEGFLPENVSHRSGAELEFDVGQLKPGESKPIELVLGTRGPGVHTARFTARADGGIEVQQAVQLEVTAPALELRVDMPVRRFLQRPAACTITMVNAGTAPARSVELAAQLPPGMKFVKANNAGWHDERNHRVLWNLEELPPGESGAVEVVVMPVELGPQKIFAAARSADGLADQIAHVCDVEGLAALVFDVTDSEDPIEIEGVTEYVVRVGNQGTKAATGVRLTATLLGDLEPVEAQGPVGHRVENLSVAFEPLAKLAPSEEAVFRIRAQGHAAGDHRVQVQITSEDHPAPITKEETTTVYLDR